MRAAAGRLDGLQKTDAFVGRAIRPPVAFFCAVDPAEFQRVDAQLFRQLIDDRFGGKGRVRSARRAVGRRARLIDHHIIAVDQHVVDAVRRKDHPGPRPHRRARVGPGLIGQVSLRGGDFPVLVRAHLDPDMRTRGRAGRREHFRAAHGHFHRAAAGFL